MSRSVREWIGKTDDAMPGSNVRDRLSARQGDKCACCGRPFGPAYRANCDHIKALRDGGENRESNLQMLCNWCHVEKTSAEATSRAKTSRIRAKRLGFDQVTTNRWARRPLGHGNHQHSATSPIRRKSDRHHEEPTR